MRSRQGTRRVEIKEASRYGLKSALFCPSYVAKGLPAGELLDTDELPSEACIRGHGQAQDYGTMAGLFLGWGKAGNTMPRAASKGRGGTNRHWQPSPTSAPSCDTHTHLALNSRYNRMR